MKRLRFYIARALTIMPFEADASFEYNDSFLGRE